QATQAPPARRRNKSAADLIDKGLASSRPGSSGQLIRLGWTLMLPGNHTWGYSRCARALPTLRDKRIARMVISAAGKGEQAAAAGQGRAAAISIRATLEESLHLFRRRCD